MLTGSEFLSSGWSWPSFLLFISGILFTSYAIGQFVGKGFSRTVKEDARIGIISGCLCLMGGVVWFVMTWTSIMEKPLSNAPEPILIISLGTIFIYLGWRKWRNSRVTGRI